MRNKMLTNRKDKIMSLNFIDPDDSEVEPTKMEQFVTTVFTEELASVMLSSLILTESVDEPGLDALIETEQDPSEVKITLVSLVLDKLATRLKTYGVIVPQGYTETPTLEGILRNLQVLIKGSISEEELDLFKSYNTPVEALGYILDSRSKDDIKYNGKMLDGGFEVLPELISHIEKLLEETPSLENTELEIPSLEENSKTIAEELSEETAKTPREKIEAYLTELMGKAGVILMGHTIFSSEGLALGQEGSVYYDLASTLVFDEAMKYQDIASYHLVSLAVLHGLDNETATLEAAKAYVEKVNGSVIDATATVEEVTSIIKDLYTD